MLRSPEDGLYFVFKIVEWLSQTWRNFNGGTNLIKLFLKGHVFQI
jgi:hypothetical protein